MKTLKTPEQTIRELKEEIRVSKKWMRKWVKEGNYVEAQDYKSTIATCEFVIALIRGELD